MPPRPRALRVRRRRRRGASQNPTPTMTTISTTATKTPTQTSTLTPRLLRERAYPQWRVEQTSRSLWASVLSRGRKHGPAGSPHSPSIGRSASAPPEDRIAAGAYEESENDQYQAEDDLALKELHDPRDDEDDCDDPQNETHVTASPTRTSPPRNVEWSHRHGDVSITRSGVCPRPAPSR